MKALMIQGTASGVGKSVLVAGLCRLLARNGVRVAPFKPQNMSNNAAVTVDGGEIGRAQALQAFACSIEPTVHMNPVLLKPEADCTSQLVVRGKVVGKLESARFREEREQWLNTVLESFELLCDQYDVVLVEGAGSPAEPNLRDGDIANMGFAEAADIPVWLVGDIDCGGVFASLTGTLNILSESEQTRVTALLINRFRGYLALLDDGVTWLEEKSGKPVAGVIPWLPLELPEEDAPYRLGNRGEATPGKLNIAVIALPRMSNIDDFDPLAAEPGVSLRFVNRTDELQPADLIILPGSKHVAADLAWLQEQGFVQALQKHLRYGGKVLGICGGMQMLGREIIDEAGMESAGSVAGLGWLNMTTTMQPEKTLKRVDAVARWPQPVPVHGYEIHYGDDHPDAAIFPFSHRSDDGQVWGSYLHGLFDSGPFRAAWLAEMGVTVEAGDDHAARVMASLDMLADTLETNIAPELLAPLLGR
ncbi:adenosylcobyric acid synthase (glutamine-hydrolysing) [Mariprofundus ferrinatatus]|uniref:Cobyric acid synthase n=1 Tax=Mariprofundus ferrinatatus TaxID=1921087 RepID=A0A2K8L995_9PROT|nr:cobyric acid synthase [Mariprofundus ferrinatatus]ATX82829.1 adenosylcobyric acid synthase (glutamine-hydrolysing) [Mariprofundus ferrinatatus]